jgi:tRNA G46 methylase TrmB
MTRRGRLAQIRRSFNVQTASLLIHSAQTEPHKDLLPLLDKYRGRTFQKPIAAHTRAAFEHAERLVQERGLPLILDSCCGVGMSTVHLAREFRGHFVLGLDKSAARFAKHHAYRDPAVSNYALVRAEVIDFWRLAAQREWQVARHYLLYPNPWPKITALKKRFHGHPAFLDFIKLGQYFELRSNWEIYVREFEAAFFHCTGARGAFESFTPAIPITPFEKKYLRSGHELFRLTITRS